MGFFRLRSVSGKFVDVVPNRGVERRNGDGRTLHPHRGSPRERAGLACIGTRHFVACGFFTSVVVVVVFVVVVVVVVIVVVVVVVCSTGASLAVPLCF